MAADLQGILPHDVDQSALRTFIRTVKFSDDRFNKCVLGILRRQSSTGRPKGMGEVSYVFRFLLK